MLVEGEIFVEVPWVLLGGEHDILSLALLKLLQELLSKFTLNYICSFFLKYLLGTYFMAGTVWACGEYESCLKHWSLECKVLVAQPCFFATPWILTCQAPLYMRFPRKEHWTGLPFPPPGDIPNPGIKPGFPALQRQILYHLNQRASSFLNVGMVYKVMWGKKALSRTKEEVRLNG